MHHNLRHRKDRLRQTHAIDSYGTHYVNAAAAPRTIEREAGRCHHFLWVELARGRVSRAASLWVTRTGAIAAADWWVGQAIDIAATRA
jgi:uncharacterized protein (TIGR04168 family)